MRTRNYLVFSSTCNFLVYFYIMIHTYILKKNLLIWRCYGGGRNISEPDYNLFSFNKLGSNPYPSKDGEGVRRIFFHEKRRIKTSQKVSSMELYRVKVKSQKWKKRQKSYPRSTVWNTILYIRTNSQLILFGKRVSGKQ